eukprot:1319672-Karenia_brevis.AAC.1
MTFTASQPGRLGGWTALAAWTAWMDGFHCLEYLDGQPEGSAWMTFTAWITWMDNLSCLEHLDGRP